MVLRAWWLDFKLERVRRKLKKAHFEQRRLRDRLEKAKADRKAGKLTDEAFSAKEDEIRAKRAAVTEHVAALNAEEDALKHERQRVERATS